ncbi:peptidoglycan editing factor PgeF [Candidatus Pelagibacter sp.]|nr:peptidoglycan editing factor PgeF [Candidatus Pelagibacter sp.]
MLQSKKLSKIIDITHGFFNRKGGVSKGIYKSLNCGPGSKDKKINIQKNLKIVKNKICRNSNKIFLLKQIHSNKFIYIGNSSKINNRSRKADAVITDKRKFPIAVLTADCVPLLIYDKKRKMIAAIHAGWKGAYKEIIQRVIEFMLTKGCNLKDMTVAIGPSIAMKNYEVKNDFINKFIKKNKKNLNFFININDKIYFNLPNYVKTQVKLSKIKNIDVLNIDTFNKKNNFFSARRSLKLNHDDYGRNISIIMIN